MKLDITGLTKVFDGKRVLSGISLHLDNIRSLVIIGPSGGGKSTLLRIIAGLLVPEEGTIAVNGHAIPSEEKALRDYRKTIGMVFQSYNLFPHLTAAENIMLPLVRVHGYEPERARVHAMGLLERFQLSAHAEKKPALLSGGQKQRIAIARAVAVSPSFLLFDEPTSALDPEFTSEVLDVIEELREEGKDLILVTHEMGFAKIVSDYALFLDEGIIAGAGTPSEIFDTPDEQRLVQFLDKVLKY
jgi:polar amino acid transport system ATP-binding protein